MSEDLGLQGTLSRTYPLPSPLSLQGHEVHAFHGLLRSMLNQHPTTLTFTATTAAIAMPSDADWTAIQLVCGRIPPLANAYLITNDDLKRQVALAVAIIVSLPQLQQLAETVGSGFNCTIDNVGDQTKIVMSWPETCTAALV